MTRPVPICRDVRIGCPFCDYMAAADWIDEAVREVRHHAKTVHGHEMTDHEAAVLARSALEKRDPV